MTLTTLVAALLDAAHQKNDFQNDDERLRCFGDFLRRHRLGIPVDTAVLGNFVRLPNRIGKPVSQEEFAEAIGVSRCWYGLLEVGRPVQPSIALMERIGDTLMLNEADRVELFELGVPALSQYVLKAILGRSSRAA